MLLKQSTTEKRTKSNVSSKQQRASAAMKLTVGLPTPRVSRKVMKGVATKRSAVGQQRLIAARAEERTAVDPCDNSNDSGLGFDHHLEFQLAARSTVRFTDQEVTWANEHSEVKRKKLEIKLESDDANDDFSFPETMSRRERRGEETQRVGTRSGAHLDRSDAPGIGMLRSTQSHPQAIASRRTASLPVTSQAAGAMTSRNGKTQLQIVCQPETQHRARYQTEGSRGAVKDRSGNGFPVVKLINYNKPATLEVFIGTDVGRIQPHMFYQACRVSGKNSTPCLEKKIDGTIVIEVDFDPAKDYVITCDCVGILKERNVDVEHRFPNEQQSRNKKKSTRCRMVFRTKIVHSDGSEEWLQITSHPIVCTQPPGVPEICKKSLTSCPSTGGLELFILGKNFLKDTRVLFQLTDADSPWEEAVQPDKEFLQQTHLVCVVPPFHRTDIAEPVTVRLAITSSGKTSESHNFTYTPVLQPPAVAPEGTQPCAPLAQSAAAHAGADMSHAFPRTSLVPPGAALVADAVQGRASKLSPKKSHYMPLEPTPNISGGDCNRPMMWQPPLLQSVTEAPKLENKLPTESKEMDRVMSGKMMPPPPLLPISARRTSSNVRLVIPDPEPASSLKTELTEDGNSRSPEDAKGIDLRMKPMPLKPVATVTPLGSAADLSNAQAPTLATFQRFVTGNTLVPLPNQSGPSVEKFLSNIEQISDPNAIAKPADAVQACKMAETVSHALFPQQQSVGNISVPLMFDAQNASEHKQRYSAEHSSLLQQGRRKSGYEDAMNLNPEPDPLIARRHMVAMQETQSRNPMIGSSIMTAESPLLMYANAEREEKMQALVSQIQAAENEKLDALVNTMNPNRVTTDQTPPIPVKKMSLDPSGYSMMPTCDPLLSSTGPQLSRTSSVMFTSLEKTSPESNNQASSARTVLNAMSHDLHSSASPIAVKKIMEASSETQILVTDPANPNNSPIMTRTSPIAIKSMIEQVTATSPIAMKSILNSEVSESLVPVSTVEALVQSSSADITTLSTLIPTSTENAVLASVGPAASALVQSAINRELASTAAHAAVESAIAQTILNNQNQQALLTSNSQVSGENARLNSLAHSLLNGQNQQQTILASSSTVSEESARLTSLTQSLLSGQNQQQTVLASSAHVSEESARLSSLTQSLLNSQAQQQEENARLNSLTQSMLSGQNQQSVLASGSSISEETARLTLTQSLLSSQNQQASEENARLNSLLNQNQQQLSDGSTRLNSLLQSQQTVLTSVAGESARLNSLTQSLLNEQAVSQEAARLNSLTQVLLSSQSQERSISDNMRLNSLTQSLLSSHNHQAASEETTRLNTLSQSLLSGQTQQQTMLASGRESQDLTTLVQTGLASHRQSDPQTTACITAIVTQPSQTVSHVPVTSVAEQVLLRSMFPTNQNPTTTVIVGDGNMLQGSSYTATTTTAASQTLIANKEAQRGSRDSSTGFVTQVLLGLTDEKLKKEASSSKEEKPQPDSLSQQPPQQQQQPKKEEGLLTHDLAEMSDTDLLCYINPSTFDQV